MYKITKLIFNEKQGIVCFEMQDEYGNTFNPFISQNKPLSEPNKDNLIDLPELSAESFVFTADTKTVKPAPKQKKKTASDTLTEFCKAKKGIQGTNLASLRKFYEFYLPKTEKWNGRFDAETLWQRWSAREN